MIGRGILSAVGFLLLGRPAIARLVRSHTSSTHPVEGVIKLLEELRQTAEDEGKAEALTYQKFEHWCDRSQKQLSETIAGEKALIEALNDKIDASEKTIEILTKEIAGLNEELQRLAAAGSAADADRAALNNLYQTKMSDLTGTIEAIGSALTHLTSARATVSASSLIQKHMGTILAIAGTRISNKQRSLLETFAKPRPNLTAEGDYQDHQDTYAFKSDSAVELLKDLKSRFESELVEAAKSETNSVNAYNLAKQARTDLVNAATDSKTAKTAAKGEEEGKLADAQNARTDAENDLSADTGTLTSTTQDCQVKASEWAERSKVRTAEIEATTAAIGILAKVTGVRTEAPGNPVPPASPVFFQLAIPQVQQALNLLRQEARTSHSNAIDQIAQAVAANTEGPFDQVVNSIQKMIFRLENEQKEEDNHKLWCDKELQKTDDAIADQDDKLAELTSKIGVAKTRAQSLQTDIVAADEKVTEIVDHMKEATEIRKVGKEENTLAVKDAEAAQTALAQAVAVMKDFYKDSGKIQKKSWESFMQRAPVTLPSNPKTWGASYTGVDGAEGVIAVLESAASDFAKMEADTLAQEEQDQQLYAEDMSACKVEKARASKESQMKAQERKRLLAKLTSMTEAHKGVSNEKEATNQYKSDLQPACVEGSSSYSDRKSARAKEVVALKAAQDHLQSAFKDDKSR